jgi:hypothetical protein
VDFVRGLRGKSFFLKLLLKERYIINLAMHEVHPISLKI